MTGHSLRLGRIGGIEVDVHWSWLLIFILFTWSIATALLPSVFPSWSAGTYWLVGAISAVLVFVSVLAHELAHSLLARREGIPVRNITLFVFGGVSNIQTEPKTARVEFWMALVGPLTSLVLGALAYAILRVGAAVWPPELKGILLVLAYYNVSLGVFNLLPAFPLDGGRVFRAIVWAITRDFRKATGVATLVGQLFGYLAIFGGLFLAIGGSFLDGLWLIFIGWFLNSAAETSRQQVLVESALKGIRVSAVMRPDPVEVPADTTLLDVVEHYVLGRNLRRLPVVSSDQRLLGVVGVAEIRPVPRERWATTTVRQVMRPADALTVARPDEPLAEVLRELSNDDVNQLPVVDHGKVVGILSRSDVIRYLQVRRDLGHIAA